MGLRDIGSPSAKLRLDGSGGTTVTTGVIPGGAVTLKMDDWAAANAAQWPFCGSASTPAMAHVTMGGGHAVTLNDVMHELPPVRDMLYL